VGAPPQLHAELSRRPRAGAVRRVARAWSVGCRGGHRRPASRGGLNRCGGGKKSPKKNNVTPAMQEVAMRIR